MTNLINTQQQPEQLTAQQFVRYSRQIMLDDWGEQRQIALGQRHVIIVGAGGLGNIAASFLAGAGVGTLTIIDGDEVELSNLGRQIAFDTDSIENAKVFELTNRLREQNPTIELIAEHCYVADNNIATLLAGADLVLDCSDNFVTRDLINQHCVDAEVALLSASVAQWQGQLMLIDPALPQSGCYHCLFPSTDSSEIANNCHTLGVAGAMVGVLGSLQASEALRYLIGASSELAAKFLVVDGISLTINHFSRSRNSQCPICTGNKP